jgi:hypothetical protein
MFWLFTFTIPFPDSSIRTCEVTSAHRFPAPHCAFITCQPGPGKTPPYCPHAGTAKSSTITAIDPIRKNTERFLIGFSSHKRNFWGAAGRAFAISHAHSSEPRRTQLQGRVGAVTPLLSGGPKLTTLSARVNRPVF